jgi:hypothetical protein
MAVLRPKFVLDDTFAQHVDNSYCPTFPTGTPNPPNAPALPDVDRASVSLSKSCGPAFSAEHNGHVGQQWDCSVAVIASSSISGSFDCSAGATCTIDGSDFDASGAEMLDYSLFVTATQLQDTYSMQNCAEGSYDDGSGTDVPVAGNCVSAQWEPRTSIDKTCDSIEAVNSGPMTLSCQINVTGTDLATGSYVMAGDAFAALPPVTATIAGTMMNVTSNEPWSCVDEALNAPGSIGVCELSAADMLSAGGSSTLTVNFDFTVGRR